MENGSLTALQNAVKVIAAQRQRLDEAESKMSGPIAVTGMACRYPGGADTPEGLWALFESGSCPVAARPASRSSWPELTAAPGFYLADIERFDAAFFGISPREARLMDPQQRLLLEITHEAMINAEIAPSSRCGVFIGAMAVDYAGLAQRPDLMDVHTGTGTAASILAGRLSHQFDLRGPATVINTSCSSSLVAVHQAMVALRRGECDVAIAGGVNVILAPEIWQIERAAGMLAPDGLCKAFAEAADGFGRGEGCGLVVLKRLADAQAGGNPIHAVLLGSAVNHDGRAAGLMVPNPRAQSAVIRAALADAGVAPLDVSYVETHGTGTRLGDPVEAEALAEAYGANRERPLLLGAAKANLGHTEGAAGITSLLRLILSLRAGHLPPHRMAGPPSRIIDWASSRLALARGGERFDGAARAIGAVSSFGFSGTNAHVIAAAPEGSPPRRETARTQWAQTRYWVPAQEGVAVTPAAPRGSLHVIGQAPLEVVAGAALPSPICVLNHNDAMATPVINVLRQRSAAPIVVVREWTELSHHGGMIVLCPSDDAASELHALQAMIASGPRCRIAVIATLGSPSGEAVSAYLRSAFVDDPARAGPLIMAGPGVAAERLADCLAVQGERQITALATGLFAPRLKAVPPPCRPPFSPSATRPYLITGGYGSLGLELAGWLVAKGARHIALLGRNAPSGDVRVAEITSQAALWSRILGWRAQGVTVRLLAADVGDRPAMQRMFASELPGLAGIIHAAGVSNAHGRDLASVLHAKVGGALLLEELVRGLDLDLLLFCSSAAVWGGGQLSGYAAANAFMDGVARRCAGARSIQFGGWQGSAMLADEALRGYQQRRGFNTLPPARMLELLDAALRLDEPVCAAVDLDAAAYRHSLKPSGLDRFMDSLQPATAETGNHLHATIAAAHPGRRNGLLLRTARDLAAKLLGHPTPDALGVDQPLQDLGFNSLVALEFRDGLAASLKVDLPATLIYANPTLRAVADFITPLFETESPPQGEVAAAHQRLAALLAGHGG